MYSALSSIIGFDGFSPTWGPSILLICYSYSVLRALSHMTKTKWSKTSVLFLLLFLWLLTCFADRWLFHSLRSALELVFMKIVFFFKKMHGVFDFLKRKNSGKQHTYKTIKIMSMTMTTNTGSSVNSKHHIHSHLFIEYLYIAIRDTWLNTTKEKKIIIIIIIEMKISEKNCCFADCSVTQTWTWMIWLVPCLALPYVLNDMTS